VTKEEKGKVEEIRERERLRREQSNLAADKHLDGVFVTSNWPDIPFLLDLTHRLDVTCRQLQEEIADHGFGDEQYCCWCSGQTPRFGGPLIPEHDESGHERTCPVLVSQKVLNEE